MKKLLAKTGLTKKITRQRLEQFIKKYANSGRTLDIGCGSSPYAKYFQSRIGIDVQPQAGVAAVVDAHNLQQFKDGEFDCVLCTEVLEHLHTPAQAIAEMQRVLKKNGILILTTRFIFPLHDIPGDYFRFTKYGLKHLLRDFEILEIQEETNTIGTLAVLLQRIGFQCETLAAKPLRLGWLALAKVVKIFSFIITKEYGDIKHQTTTKNILTSGYYVAARKK